ncbi:MAG TPA: hypothetical protein VFB36_03940 [Nevskiaceae bacterium]|nr:hypothetical protein [Nevskiaceae bacterium]
MKVLFGCAAVLVAAVAVPGAHAASRGGECSVTHHDCYPACVQMTPDGSDCARTRQVCKDICGPKPAYPAISNTERADIQRFEEQRYNSGNVTILPSNPRSPSDVSSPVDPAQEAPYVTSPPNP